MTTLTLDEVKVARKGRRMPVALDDPDDGIDDHVSDEFTDDNSNDDQFFDG